MQTDVAYEETRLIQQVIGGRELNLAHRPAIDDRTALTPSEELLISQATLGANDRVLVSPCGSAAVAAWAAMETDPHQVVAMDTNAIALQLARLTLAANGLAETPVRTGLPTDIENLFDVALLDIPKGRRLSQLHVLSAALMLAQGGRLYVAGANNAGIKSILRDCERLLGPGALLGYRKGNRIARFVRQEIEPANLPAPFDAPGLWPGTFLRHSVQVAERPYTLLSRPGVFGHGKLDAGTAMLLKQLDLATGARVLDAGCGVGIIGMVAAQKVGPSHVTLTDVDSLACECARATLKANELHGACIHHADCLNGLEQEAFDLIASNPPFHAGHAVNLRITEALVQASYRALVPGGRLMLVANRFLPYDRLLRASFGNANLLASDRRYGVLTATKTSRPSD